MRYVNHASAKSGGQPNAYLVHTEDSPYVQLRLLRRVAANEELKMDYGEAYPYAARGFTR